MGEDWVVLVQSEKKKDVREASAILKTTPIDYVKKRRAPESDAKYSLSVHKDNYNDAKTALREGYVSIPLPKGHHLLGFSEPELIDLVKNSEDWSAYDVAHAETILEERGIDISKIEISAEERVAKQKLKKKANLKMIAGVVAVIVIYIFAKFVVRFF